MFYDELLDEIADDEDWAEEMGFETNGFREKRKKKKGLGKGRKPVIAPKKVKGVNA